MPSTFPGHIQAHVIVEMEGGSSICAAARKFSVAISTVSNWWHAYLEDNRLDAKPRGGDRHSARSEQHSERVLGWVEAQADMTLVENCARLAEQGCNLAVSTVWALLRRKGCTRQKEAGHACEQARDDVEVMRPK